jgi:hypothetical protein
MKPDQTKTPAAAAQAARDRGGGEVRRHPIKKPAAGGACGRTEGYWDATRRISILDA